MLSLDRRRKRKGSSRAGGNIQLTRSNVPSQVVVEQLAFPETNTQLPRQFVTKANHHAQNGFFAVQEHKPSNHMKAFSPVMGQFVEPKNMVSTNVGKTTALRQPVVVPGGGKKSEGLVVPPSGRRFVVHGAVGVLLLFILVSSLMAVLPVDIDAQGATMFNPIMNLVSNKKSGESALIASQAATATAVTEGGYDPGGDKTYAGVKGPPTHIRVPAIDAGHLNRFFYGQCTYWANMRYHEMTGHWVPWLGNAYQWSYQAPAYGWSISSTPNPNGPSIAVLAPYAQNSSSYGHVAIVERVNDDGSVLTSNWNWNGAWATHSWVTFYPGYGISFIWFPN